MYLLKKQLCDILIITTVGFEQDSAYFMLTYIFVYTYLQYECTINMCLNISVLDMYVPFKYVLNIVCEYVSEM